MEGGEGEEAEEAVQAARPHHGQAPRSCIHSWNVHKEENHQNKGKTMGGSKKGWGGASLTVPREDYNSSGLFAAFPWTLLKVTPAMRGISPALC